MSQDNLIKLSCTVCKRINYYSTRNKKKLQKVRIELRKYCPWDREHTLHKEVK